MVDFFGSCMRARGFGTDQKRKMAVGLTGFQVLDSCIVREELTHGFNQSRKTGVWALSGLDEISSSTPREICVWPRQNPTDLGWDSFGRDRFMYRDIGW